MNIIMLIFFNKQQVDLRTIVYGCAPKHHAFHGEGELIKLQLVL